MLTSFSSHKQHLPFKSSGTFACGPAVKLLILFTLLFIGAASVPSLLAAENTPPATLQKRYDVAKYYYHNLIIHRKLGASKPRWEKTIRVFRQIYLENPKKELGLLSLFMMGRLYHEMYSRFHNPQDLNEAITYYDDVALLFPTSSLADDALYILGKIYLHDKNTPRHAGDIFYQITCQYPQGDMARRAGDELHALKYKDKQNKAKQQENKSKHSSKLVQVLPIKFWSTDNYTRVVVQTTAPVNFSEQLLEKNANRPQRLFIDLNNSHIPPKACRPIPIQDGLLKRVRAGQHNSDTVRVVLDIESIARYKIFTLQDPFRAVIDVHGHKKQRTENAPLVVLGTENSKKRAPNKKTNETQMLPSLAQQLGLGIRRIVIDPGHGGKDPGAIAPNGLKEKDIVLDVSKILSEQLRKKLFCEVILTRTRDVFIPLEERTAIANTERGDLFVSVHVNSAPSPRVKGVETYVLNLTNDEEAMQLAAFENSTSKSNMSDLQGILDDLLNNSKLDESTKLAEFVQNNMVRGLNLKDLGVKQAPFYVLIGAQMPAILIEITFMSNPREANRLRDANYLAAIAEQMSAGITDYVSSTSLAMAVPGLKASSTH